jgi:hypothetical protein
MTEHEEDDEPAKPAHRSGWRRFLKRAALILGILAFIALLARWQVGRIGQRHLDGTTAHLDATEPDWRLDDLEAARTQAAPPADKNPANVIIAFHKSIPPEWNSFFGNSSREWDWGPVMNYQPSFFEFIWLIEGDGITSSVREKYRPQLLRPEIISAPAGHYVVIQNENPIMTLLPDIQNSRTVAGLIELDARIFALQKKGNEAIGSTRASLVVARSIGDEPYLISQLVRITCGRIAVQSALRVLAWSEPKEGLAELQKELRAEADVPWLQYGIRGERGGFNKLFEGLKSGKIDMAALEGNTDQKSMLKSVAFRAYKPFLPGDQAKTLEILTAYLEATKLPAHEQKAALEQIKMPPQPPEDIRYVITNLLMPACVKVAEASWRNRADLLTGSVAIACERYRIANGRWPDSLSNIPRDILPDIPIDPYNGKPIQYQKLVDGVAIFSVGNEQDAEKRKSGEIKDPIGHLGRGWKLWNKELRGLPHPLPITKPDEP